MLMCCVFPTQWRPKAKYFDLFASGLIRSHRFSVTLFKKLNIKRWHYDEKCIIKRSRQLILCSFSFLWLIFNFAPFHALSFPANHF